MTPATLLFFRLFISAFIFLALMGRDTKKAMTIQSGEIGKLVIYVTLSLMLVLFIYISIEHMPLIYVSLCQNMMPLLTAVLAYFIFNKGLGLLDSAVLVISFGGIALLLVNSAKLPNLPENQENPRLLIPIITMVSLPFINTGIQLVLRTTRKMGDLTLGMYVCLSMVALYIPYLLFISNEKWDYLAQFTYGDYLLVLTTGGLNVLVNIFRTKASQYQEPAKLACISYFQSIILLSFDVLFFNIDFSSLQILGIGVVLGAVTLRWAYGIQNTYFKT